MSKTGLTTAIFMSNWFLTRMPRPFSGGGKQPFQQMLGQWNIYIEKNEVEPHIAKVNSK